MSLGIMQDLLLKKQQAEFLCTDHYATQIHLNQNEKHFNYWLKRALRQQY